MWNFDFLRRQPLVFSLLATVLLLVGPGTSVRAKEKSDENWPSFRGHHATGIAKGHETVTEWNIEDGTNILWKQPIPGLGHSSPVIWGDKIFLTTAVTEEDPYLKVGLYGASPEHIENYDHEFKVYCLDRNTGEMIWEQLCHRGVPKVKRHIKASHANSTPATDGTRLITFFGSEGLYCHDLEGKLLWKKDLGVFDSGPFNAKDLQWSFASSPILHDGKIFLQCDARNQAFLLALDASTGKEIWKTARNDVPTWSTPTIVTEGQPQILVNGFKHIGGYDIKTGKELWMITGGGDVPVPTPVFAHGMAFITNAHGSMAPMYAVKLGASGTISTDGDSDDLAWLDRRSGAYMQTPLVYGDLLFSCSDGGILKCYEARTGERLYRKRLGRGKSGFSASPVAADGKLYFTSEVGETYVIPADPEWDILARNELDEVCMATPAISSGILYFRTQGHLIAVGSKN